MAGYIPKVGPVTRRANNAEKATGAIIRVNSQGCKATLRLGKRKQNYAGSHSPNPNEPLLPSFSSPRHRNVLTLHRELGRRQKCPAHQQSERETNQARTDKGSLVLPRGLVPFVFLCCNLIHVGGWVGCCPGARGGPGHQGPQDRLHVGSPTNIHHTGPCSDIHGYDHPGIEDRRKRPNECISEEQLYRESD